MLRKVGRKHDGCKCYLYTWSCQSLVNLSKSKLRYNRTICVSNEKKSTSIPRISVITGEDNASIDQLIRLVIEVIYMWHWPDSDFDLFLIISSSSQLSRCQAAVAMFFKFAPSVKCAMKLVNIALYVPFHWYFLSLLYVKCTCQKRIESKNSLSKNIFIAVNVKL